MTKENKRKAALMLPNMSLTQRRPQSNLTFSPPRPIKSKFQSYFTSEPATLYFIEPSKVFCHTVVEEEGQTLTQREIHTLGI